MQDGQDSFTKSANNSRNCRQFPYFFEGLDVSLAKKKSLDFDSYPDHSPGLGIF